MTGELPGWLTDPALSPLWAAARDRLERNGVQVQGRLRLDRLDRAGRHAVGGLLGRPVVSDAVPVDLATVDELLRARSGVGGLVAVLEALGGPLHDRVAERSGRRAAREAPYAVLRRWLDEHPDVRDRPWVQPWVAGLRRAGILARLDPQRAGTVLVRAAQVAAHLTAVAAADVAGDVAAQTGGDPAGHVSRTQLAATWARDAHALDEGSPTGHLVLRALALAAGQEAPASTAGRRALWERFGVSVDAVSSTCLTVGLRPLGDDPVSRRLRLGSDAGDPVHLTGWDLARSDLSVAPRTWVLVCENPRVLEAVAETRGGAVSVVCTAGVPNLLTVDLLSRLGRAGAVLAYHGDFDWPGIAIANRLLGQLGCRPWRMTAEAYVVAAAEDGLPLEGAPVEPSWDADLGAAMRDRAVAVHEEAVLEHLLAALPAG